MTVASKRRLAGISDSARGNATEKQHFISSLVVVALKRLLSSAGFRETVTCSVKDKNREVSDRL